MNQLTFTASALTRGFFLRHCGKDLEARVKLDFYDHKNQLLTTDQPGSGFITDKSNPHCKVLSIRGVHRLDIIRLADLKGHVELTVAPEHWVMTTSIGGFYASVLVVSLLYNASIACQRGFCDAPKRFEDEEKTNLENSDEDN